MRLRQLRICDRKVFERYLGLKRHELSSYSFANIFIWQAFYKIRWAVINGCLCLFFEDGCGMFQYLPVLGNGPCDKAVEEAYGLMARSNKGCCRIENIEESEAGYYRGLGFECLPKFPDYICSRQRLAQLRGNLYKSKRASCNYFLKNYEFGCFELSKRDHCECLELYERWADAKGSLSQDKVYRGMLEDSFACLKTALRNYRQLGFFGLAVKVSGKIMGFTFGFRLNADTFCILYEVADLSVKGLAQFIFREFCIRLEGYTYINVMDDSGLHNLRRVKLSYKPVKEVKAYIASRSQY